MMISLLSLYCTNHAIFCWVILRNFIVHFSDWFLILHVRSKYPVGEMFHQADLSQFFWGTLGLLKGKMNREQNILEITKSPNALDNFLKEYGVNVNETATRPKAIQPIQKPHLGPVGVNIRPWTMAKHPHHMSSSKSPWNLISTINFWCHSACKISLFWGKIFGIFLSSVLNYSFWMSNFAARKWLECRILHHLSQGFRGP